MKASPRGRAHGVSARAPGPGGEVRIIGGQWKRSKLPVPDRPGLRPTPDRVRETLFNWLGQDLSGMTCLDAFAGSGALGLEAASRGAARVCLIERDPTLAQALRHHATRLGASHVEVLQTDAVRWMAQAAGQRWDVIFLDPPFGDAASGWNESLFQRALQAAAGLLVDDGLLYLEAPRAWTAAQCQPLGLALHRQGKAGMVHFHLLARDASCARPEGPGDNLTP